jgi:hypothetical protein
VLDDPGGAWPFGVALAAAGAVLWMASVVVPRVPRPTSHRVGCGWLARLDRILVGEGPLLGITAFTSAMLYRSPGYRAKVLPIFGLPAAMIGLSLWEADPRHRLVLLGITLQLPAIYLPLLTAFLAQADEEGCSWIFSTSPSGSGPTLARQAALVSLSTHVLLPTHLVGGLVMVCSNAGGAAAVALASFSFGAAVITAWMVLRGLPCVPFTDEDQGISADVGSLFGLALVLGSAGGVFATFAHQPWGVALGIGALVAAVRRLTRGGDVR